MKGGGGGGERMKREANRQRVENERTEKREIGGFNG